MSASVLAATAGNQILLRNFEPADGTPETLAADASGHLFAASILATGSTQTSRVVEFDLTGTRLASLDVPQLEYPTASTIDTQGNLIVVGRNQSYQGTVWKIDSQLHSAVLLKSLPAGIAAVTTDAAGNIYLTGSTSSASFPLTSDAYQTMPPISAGIASASFAFLTKISPAGDNLLYSTYFGSNAFSCVGGSFCVDKAASTGAVSIALDVLGAVIIAGNTTATGLPATPGALSTTCNCGYYYFYGGANPSGFIAKFQLGAAQQLEWCTFLNAGSFGPISMSLNAMALDSVGNVILGGGGPPGMPTTSGTYDPSPPPDGSAAAFLIKLNTTGTSVIWGTYYGNQSSTAVSALLPDAQGNVVVIGRSPYGLTNNLAGTWLVRFAGDGSAVIESYSGPASTLSSLALAVTSGIGFAAVYSSGALWIQTTTPGPSLLNIANSASGLYSSTLGLGELITLYGARIGPQTPMTGQIVEGFFTSSLGGYQVLFNGKAVPLLYADSGQINTVVPHWTGLTAHIQVVTPSGVIDGPTGPATGANVLGIFQDNQSGMAAALNQDGSINSSSNPAKAGSVVAIFVDGIGSASAEDGQIVPATGLYEAPASVWVVTGERSLEVEFAGDAPGLVAGVTQVNFLLPESLALGQFSFTLIVNGTWTVQGNVFVAP